MEYAFKKQIVEALIFASDIPLAESRIISLVEELDHETLQKIIDELTIDYQQAHRAIVLTKVAGGYQIVTRPEFAPWLKKFFRGKTKTRLSQAALEVLAIIAFKQPISRPQIEAIRGTQCDGVIKNLLERNLITISGRSEALGRPLLYKTTEEFLRYFGINQISDLPKPKEIDEIVTDEDTLIDSIQKLSAQMGQRDLFSGLDIEQITDDNE
jgi:segregation and condensation protein B